MDPHHDHGIGKVIAVAVRCSGVWPEFAPARSMDSSYVVSLCLDCNEKLLRLNLSDADRGELLNWVVER